MKKLTILLLLILLVSVFVVPTAFASSNEYIEITKDGVIFYDRTPYNSQPLFTLTKNCFVKYENVVGNYVEVEYHGIKGVVNKDDVDVSTKRSDVQNFYHNANFATPKNTVQLNTLPGGGNFLVNATSQDKLFPIGKYTVGGYEYLYVTCTINGTPYAGAVLLENVNWDGIITSPSNVSTNPSNPTPPQTGGSTDTGADNTNDGTDLTPDTKDPENNLVRVLLIIGICVPALIIVYLIFKPVKPSSNRYASENPRRRDDFEDFE